MIIIVPANCLIMNFLNPLLLTSLRLFSVNRLFLLIRIIVLDWFQINNRDLNQNIKSRSTPLIIPGMSIVKTTFANTDNKGKLLVTFFAERRLQKMRHTLLAPG
jgi:hypothetical protein